MIIKSFRIPTAYGSTRIRNHVFSGEDNASITIIRNTERDLEDMFRDAQADGRRYAVRHFIISPECPASREELLDVFGLLAVEFDFDSQSAVVIEHEKARATPGTFDRHFHAFVADWDRAQNKGVSTSHSFPRQEKISRRAEWSLGHPLVLGRHHRSVVMALHAEGHGEVADALEQAFPLGAVPYSRSTTHGHQQQAARDGLDLVELRKIVRDAWKNTSTAAELHEALARAALVIRPSAEPPFTWIVTFEGRFVGKLAGLAHVTKSEIRKRMGEANEPDHIAAASIEIRPDRPTSDDRKEGLGRDHQPAEPDGRTLRGVPRPVEGARIAQDDEAAFAVALDRRGALLRELAELAETAALPPALRAQRALASIERRCLSDLSDRPSPPEPSGLIRAREQAKRLIELEGAYAKAIDKSSKRLAWLNSTKPLLWGRAKHIAKITAQQQRHDALQKRLPRVTENARVWENWRSMLQTGRDKTEKQRAGQIKRITALAQLKLECVRRVRGMIQLSPKVVRWGGATLYSMFVALRVAELRSQAGAGPSYLDLDPDYEVHTDLHGIGQLPRP